MRIEIPKIQPHSTHRHFCKFGNHEWICDSPDPGKFGAWTPPVCVCPTHHVPLNRGDHSDCPLGILACSEHHLEQIKQTSEHAHEPVDLEAALSHEAPPSEELISNEEHRFLNEIVFAGLKDLTMGRGGSSLPYVSPEGFELVIERCEFLGIGINGIDMCSIDTSAFELSGSYLGTWFAGNQCYDDARQIIEGFLGEPDVAAWASFIVPFAVLTARGYCLDPKNRE